MDTIWKKRLNEDTVQTRIEGAFFDARRDAAKGQNPNDDLNSSPNEKVSRILTADAAKKQRNQDIKQIEDYFYKYYGYGVTCSPDCPHS